MLCSSLPPNQVKCGRNIIDSEKLVVLVVMVVTMAIMVMVRGYLLLD